MADIPDYQTLMLPVLRLAAEHELSVPQAVQRLAIEFNLTPDQLAERIPSGRIQLVNNRAHWAKTYLLKAGLVEQVRRERLDRQFDKMMGVDEASRRVAADLERRKAVYTKDEVLKRFGSYQASYCAEPAVLVCNLVDASPDAVGSGRLRDFKTDCLIIGSNSGSATQERQIEARVTSTCSQGKPIDVAIEFPKQGSGSYRFGALCAPCMVRRGNSPP